MSSDELSCLPNRVEGINSQPATIETNGSGKNSSLLTRQSRIRMNRYVFIFKYFFITVYILESQWVQTEIDRATAVSSLRGGYLVYSPTGRLQRTLWSTQDRCYRPHFKEECVGEGVSVPLLEISRLDSIKARPLMTPAAINSCGEK